eukprot:4679481-Pyramimonas_sp.AAC.1
MPEAFWFDGDRFNDDHEVSCSRRVRGALEDRARESLGESFQADARTIIRGRSKTAFMEVFSPPRMAPDVAKLGAP